MKKIAILGSTGSIGTQTLEIVRAQGDLRVTAMAAGRNVDLLEKQIREFRPSLAAVWEEADARDLRVRTADLDVKILSGMDGLLAVAAEADSEILVTAIVGMLGLKPTVAAIAAGKDIALANKETLVTAGHLIMPMAKAHGVRILPVDSEHSAIFQALNGECGNKIDKILLTASGGPFRGKTREELSRVTLADALRHPNWSMGRKITVDSATLVNKGLEVMEAKWLFGVELPQIQVVVQPQSVIHSMVQFVDGSVIAQLGTPDMRLPIQYALAYPDRLVLKEEHPLDMTRTRDLHFRTMDTTRFPMLKTAYEIGEREGNLGAVFNGADEQAVEMFLNGEISFLDIETSINKAIEAIAYIADPDYEDLEKSDKESREFVKNYWR